MASVFEYRNVCPNRRDVETVWRSFNWFLVQHTSTGVCVSNVLVCVSNVLVCVPNVPAVGRRLGCKVKGHNWTKFLMQMNLPTEDSKFIRTD
jgi:hypothetical protein